MYFEEFVKVRTHVCEYNAVIQVTYLTSCHVVPLHTKKASGTVEVELHAFLISALHGGELPVFLPWPIHCWGKSNTNHCTGGWVNCTDGLDVLNIEK